MLSVTRPGDPHRLSIYAGPMCDRNRDGGDARRRAVPRPARAGARRDPPGGSRRAGGGRRGRVRPRRGRPPRPGDRDRRPGPDRLDQPPPAPAAGRLHAGRPSHRHAGTPRDHLRVRRLEAAARSDRRARPRPRYVCVKPVAASHGIWGRDALGSPGLIQGDERGGLVTSRRTWLSVLTLLAALLLAMGAAACGGDDDEGGGAATTTETQEEAVTAGLVSDV